MTDDALSLLLAATYQYLRQRGRAAIARQGPTGQDPAQNEGGATHDGDAPLVRSTHDQVSRRQPDDTTVCSPAEGEPDRARV
jgi:hypothetical protein